MTREIGAPLCRATDGGLFAGKVFQGASNLRVAIPLECPPGSRVVGTIHTHPGGLARPSDADFREARRLRLAIMCVVVPETGESRCVQLKRG